MSLSYALSHTLHHDLAGASRRLQAVFILQAKRAYVECRHVAASVDCARRLAMRISTVTKNGW
ncbi:hypothetical protein DBV23_16955 [Edwardsiella ictaluri]|uniref:Uncharacterized protein n=1 Tax=Edwardsiella ictaluri TaxID=67780 RepID=A0ABY8GFQ5_EDWIC|nr:hypothetical protein [Edwardsiella ictaluri]AVZ83724.1 hypothetical protein DBV23_16955 [Edwardsiella ictaluri]EKS7764113.1 hypothetical protein [Edwardsiella ictaluri]EKS7770936.1 hypothetical protein [Edwardsiella ictaluri]EKS7774339.1 hypothetical protein [Edwardsiella ictaluri]EKS7777676.1 hypothetical protein [Edwardsiella ictaluri]